MEMSVIKDMVLGKPAPLVSTFRLSYYTILNLMSRVEGQFTAEHVIRHSFHEFQYEKVCLSNSYRCFYCHTLANVKNRFFHN
jgi:superfamily II RNA helicase